MCLWLNFFYLIFFTYIEIWLVLAMVFAPIAVLPCPISLSCTWLISTFRQGRIDHVVHVYVMHVRLSRGKQECFHIIYWCWPNPIWRGLTRRVKCHFARLECRRSHYYDMSKGAFIQQSSSDPECFTSAFWSHHHNNLPFSLRGGERDFIIPCPRDGVATQSSVSTRVETSSLVAEIGISWSIVCSSSFRLARW